MRGRMGKLLERQLWTASCFSKLAREKKDLSLAKKSCGLSRQAEENFKTCYTSSQLVEKVLWTFPPSWGKFQNLLHKFRNFVIPTGKKTLTVFFHTIFPSETFGRNSFSTVWKLVTQVPKFCDTDAKENPDGFLSHYLSLRILWPKRFFDSLRSIKPAKSCQELKV